MILSIIAATAVAGVIYATENAAQSGITKVVAARKAAKAGYVPATASAPVPMMPPMMQQPMLPPPAAFMQMPAIADTAAAQPAAAEAAAPAAASTTQAPTAQPVVNLDDMFTKIIDLVDDKLSAVAAQSAPTQPEADGPFSVGKKIAIIGEFNDAGILVDLDGRNIDDIEKVGVVHSATDPVTFIVTVKKKGKNNEYENRRFSKDMIGPMV